MILPAEIRALIEAALREGRGRLIATGVSGLPAPLPERRPERIRPEACGCGRQVHRLPGIEAYDRARQS